MGAPTFGLDRPLQSTTRVLSNRRAIVLAFVGLLAVFHTVGWYLHEPDRPTCRIGRDRAIGSVQWRPCGPGVECGSIVVPKDYFDENAGTAIIALAKLKAIESPNKGSVFLNPGGPGGSGTNLVFRLGSLLSKMLGADRDLIGFDPRGINLTSPAVRCFPSPEAERLFATNTVFQFGNTVPTTRNLSTSEDAVRTALVEQQRQVIAMKRSQAELCRVNMGDELKYMGTATVVRDIDFMAQKLDGEGAPINYWGGSYGTILGAYLVNMLPDRIGYAAIDGVADPVYWAQEPSHKWPYNWLNSTEDTYKLFFTDCSEAGPELCPLAHYQGEPWEDIEARMETFFDNLAVSPLPVPFGYRPGYLSSGTARALMLMFLEAPKAWPMAAEYYSEAMAGNGTALFSMLNTSVHAEDDLVRLAVTCLDSPPPKTKADIPTAEDLADEMIRTMKEVSPHFGMAVGVGEQDGGCEYWPVRGPERFTGPWNATLKHPMLIVSNTHDPITPISSGRKIHELMADSSVLVVQNSPGHCSVALPSLCTIAAVRAYFAGLLPANGTWCEPDVKTFPDAQDEAAFYSSLSEEDRETLDAAREMGEYFAEMRLGL